MLSSRIKSTMLASLLCSILCTPSFDVKASTNQAYNPDNELVLVTRVDKRNVPGTIIGYQGRDGNVYMPLLGLSDLFSIYINFDAQKNIAKGFLGDKYNGFEIDFNAKSFKTRDGNGSFTENDFIIGYSGDAILDIYVSEKIIEQIWPVDAQIKLSSLMVAFETLDSKLPFQLNAQRKKLQQTRIAKEKAKEEPIYPFVAQPYQAFSKPSIDFTTRLGHNAYQDSPIGDVSLSGVNDLLWASADYSIRTGYQNDRLDGPDNFRFRLTRENIYDGALPLGLEKVELGDVTQTNRDLIGRRNTGVGFTATNINQFENYSVDPIDIEERGVPGYETELYLNGQLIEVGSVDNDGLYRYDNLTLDFGNNAIKIVFYGPQGQIKEVDKLYRVNGDLVPQGETRFSFSALFAEQELFEIDEEQETQASGLTTNLTGYYGILPGLTGFASYNKVPLRVGSREQRSHDYLTTGFDWNGFNALSRFEAYKQLDGGEAAQIRTLKKINGFNLNLKWAVFDNFESQDAGVGANQLAMETEARLRRNFRTEIGNLVLGGFVRRRNFEDDRNLTTLSFNTSLNSGQNRFTNNLFSTYADFDERTTTGDFNYQRRFNQHFRIRSGTAYRIEPEFDFRNVFLEGRYSYRNRYSIIGDLEKQLDSQDLKLGLSLSKDFDNFIGGFDMEWSKNNGTSFLFRLSSSFGPYGLDGEYTSQSDPLRSAGPITAMVYQDDNYNGFYDNSEYGIEDARIYLDRAIVRDESNTDGMLNVIRNSNGRDVNVSVYEASLEDPYKKPLSRGFEVRPRPGVAQRLSFPVVNTGALDGALVDPSTGQPMSGVSLALIETSSGSSVSETVTANDGYFTFEYIYPGDYLLVSESIKNIGYLEKKVSIEKEDPFNFGVVVTQDDLKKDDFYSLLKETSELIQRVQYPNS